MGEQDWWEGVQLLLGQSTRGPESEYDKLTALLPFWCKLPPTRTTQPASCIHLMSQSPWRTGLVQKDSSGVERETTLGEGINTAA